MGEFRIVIEPEAESNIASTYSWIAARSPDGAQRWYQALERAVALLRSEPERFPVAVEGRHFDAVVRNLTFRMRSGRAYRILFTVEEATVHVLFIRGPGRDWLTP